MELACRLSRSVRNKYVDYYELCAIESDLTGEGISSHCTNQLQGNLALGAHVGAYYLPYTFPLLPPSLTERFANVVLICKPADFYLCPLPN